MPSSLVFSVNDNFTDTSLPKFYRDYLINAGSKFLFDFNDPFCNPNAALGVTSVVGGYLFNNLVDGAPGAVNMGSTTTQAADGGMVFAGTSNGATFIDLGLTYDLSASQHDFLVIGWSKCATNAGNDRSVLALGSGNSAFQYSIESTDGGATFNGVLPNTGVATQWAQRWSANGTRTFYKNGVPMMTVADATTLANYSTSKTRVGCDPGSIAFLGTIYRVYQEDLIVSGASADAQVLRDYNTNVGRFS